MRATFTKSMKKIFYLLTLLLSVAAQSVHAAQMTSGETVSITIKGVPASEQATISGDYVVSGGGLLYMPMLDGGIKASGSSSSTVARRIETAYKNAKIYTSPRITIITNRDREKDETMRVSFVTVAGHVKRPGPVKYTQGMTIYQAIAGAGEASTFGAMNRVEVIRKGKTLIFNLKKKGKGRAEKVRLGDTITVPQKGWNGN